MDFWNFSRNDSWNMWHNPMPWSGLFLILLQTREDSGRQYTANGIDTATQNTIVQNISSFALYGFPESHAASFALIAYASAYSK